MNTQNLIYFHSVAAHLNFSRAAEECHVAQAAVSRCIANLERELGFKLFERTNHKVSLTPAGQCYLEGTLAVLNKLDEARSRAKGVNESYQDFITLGFGTYEKPFLLEHVRSFRLENPRTSVTIHQFPSDELLKSLLTERCDVVYGPGNRFSDINNARTILLRKSRNCLAVSVGNPLSQLDYVTCEMLNGLRFVCPFERWSLLFEQFKRMCENMSFTPGELICANTPEAVFSTVELDIAVAFVPDHVAINPGSELKLVPLRCGNMPLKKHIAVGFQSSDKPVVKRFLDHVEKCVEKKHGAAAGESSH